MASIRLFVKTVEFWQQHQFRIIEKESVKISFETVIFTESYLYI